MPTNIFYVCTDITLCQNYDAFAKFNGFKNWNTACATNPQFAIATKKDIKEEYKRLKGTTIKCQNATATAAKLNAQKINSR